jgi:23S rRNA (guanosine2251-2'-O)-methyltransferase
MIVHGVHPVEEALATRPEAVERVWIADTARGAAIQRIFERARARGIRTERCPRARIDRLAKGAVHKGVVAQVAEIGYVEVSELLARSEGDALLVALDHVQDPIHLGAVLRSAHLLGAHGVIVPKDRAVGLTPAAVKASAGAASRLPVARVTNLARTLEMLREAGLRVVGADMEGEPCDRADLSGPLCLVIGSEGEGLRRLSRERCDAIVSVPMVGEGVGSFSVSASAAILLYEIARQRRIVTRDRLSP